ncbi:hypothetical protein [Acidovorax phage ACPWH]|nr:hypothetical protein [Acidovorax phage ACPWH]QXV72271.1 neck protein [Acidovorax phage ACF1]
MARNFALQIDASKVEELSGRLSEISGYEIGKASVGALNEVVDRTYELARDRMTAGINLDDAYLRRRMSVEHATSSRPEASITASGARGAMTTLGRYSPNPVLVNTKTGKGKGNPRLGIPAGQKQAGVTVEVIRGQRNDGFVPRGFLLPLRRGAEDGGNGFGVFARTRDGKLRHRYGPSVYQLFAYQAARFTDEVTDDLEATLVERVAQAVQKEIE